MLNLLELFIPTLAAGCNTNRFSLLFVFVTISYQRLVMCTAGNSEDIIILSDDDDDEDDEKESDLSCLIVDVKDNKNIGKQIYFTLCSLFKQTGVIKGRLCFRARVVFKYAG